MLISPFSASVKFKTKTKCLKTNKPNKGKKAKKIGKRGNSNEQDPCNLWLLAKSPFKGTGISPARQLNLLSFELDKESG